MSEFAEIETHPLAPFVHENAKLLMLGSFPPQKHRWKMPFYYPNLQNDMWRVMGLVFFQEAGYFLQPDQKGYLQPKIEAFLKETGIAIYDMAYCVRRLQDNAADQFLEVVEATDLATLLQQMPSCNYLMTTGEKATSLLLAQSSQPNLKLKIGTGAKIEIAARPYTLYRMPSSSRAYPLALTKKAEHYHNFFKEIGLLHKI